MVCSYCKNILYNKYKADTSKILANTIFRTAIFHIKYVYNSKVGTNLG